MPATAQANQIEAVYPLLTATGIPAGRAKRLAAEIYAAFIDTAPPPEITNLPRKQAQLFNYLKAHIAEHSEAPSQEECAAALGYKSRATIATMLKTLDRKGFISQGSGWREIEILKHK